MWYRTLGVKAQHAKGRFPELPKVYLGKLPELCCCSLTIQLQAHNLGMPQVLIHTAPWARVVTNGSAPAV